MVLQCKSGIYLDKFIFLNLTEMGEIIGSDTNDNLVTLAISKGNLSKRHASIKYNNGFFEVRDLDSDLGKQKNI